MHTYVALLRGIMPTNPNMRSEKLKACFESLGFENVRTVMASGNVVFETSARAGAKLEKAIEDGLEKRLGFRRAAIVRSEDELKRLVKKDPFKGVKDEKPNYLLVTFFKSGKESAAVIDLSDTSSPKFMTELEKKHGKEQTSRTWKTVHRIVRVMQSLD